MADHVSRTVDGPPGAWVPRVRAARWLGISPRLFDMLVEEGTVPQGVKLGHRTVVWNWLDLVAVGQILRWRAEGRVPHVSAHEPP